MKCGHRVPSAPGICVICGMEIVFLDESGVKVAEMGVKSGQIDKNITIRVRFLQLDKPQVCKLQ